MNYGMELAEAEELTRAEMLDEMGIENDPTISDQELAEMLVEYRREERAFHRAYRH